MNNYNYAVYPKTSQIIDIHSKLPKKKSSNKKVSIPDISEYKNEHIDYCMGQARYYIDNYKNVNNILKLLKNIEEVEYYLEQVKNLLKGEIGNG